MSDQDDLFTAGNTPQDTQNPEGRSDPLAELVGEGKKFKTPHDLVRTVKEKEDFIEQLKRENADMRTELATKSKLSAVDEALAKLNDRLENASKSGEGGTSTLTRDDIKAYLQEEKRNDKAQENIAHFQAELLKKFNNNKDEVRNFLTKRAEELGVSPVGLKEMVAFTPKLARTVLGLEQAPKAYGNTSVPSEKNSEAMGSLAPTGERNNAYYNDLRKTLGNKFWSPTIQQQLFKDRKDLGERFYK